MQKVSYIGSAEPTGFQTTVAITRVPHQRLQLGSKPQSQAQEYQTSGFRQGKKRQAPPPRSVGDC